MEARKIHPAIEPHRLRRAAAVKAANEAALEMVGDAALDEGEAADEDVCEVDMTYYQESRV